MNTQKVQKARKLTDEALTSFPFNPPTAHTSHIRVQKSSKSITPNTASHYELNKL